MNYSLDFRKKVLSLREKEALSMAAVALRFGVGKAFRSKEDAQQTATETGHGSFGAGR